MKPSEVLAICKKVAPAHGFDPLLIMAVCLQESGYDQTEVRLEQNFYRKYARPQNLPTTDEVLLAASYGLMQLMGESLLEAGYFGAWSYGNIPQKIDALMENPELQVVLGCQWLAHKMKGLQTNNVERGLRAYNGSAEYPPLVFAKWDELKKEYP
jgi:hypothetical protein